MKSMRLIEQLTQVNGQYCVKFVPRKKQETDYVFIERSRGYVSSCFVAASVVICSRI